jgi:predicted dehydrogenase
MLKAAIVGTGFMGRAHTEALRRLAIPVVGVLGSDPARAQAFARRQGIPRAYASLEELLGDREADVVHLCTPNHLHYPAARAALLRGKHVMCEKPLANSRAEATELVRLAREQRRVGALNYNLRCYPMNQEAHARIQGGQIGEPRILHAEYCQDWLFLPTDWNWRLVPELGGDLRVVGDIGTHVLDTLMWLSGLEVTELLADLATFIPVRKRPRQAVETFASKLAVTDDAEDVQIRSEDFASMLLHFSNGSHGVVTLSQINAGRKNNFWWEINGSQGSLYWRQERPNELWVGHREEPNEILLKDPALMRPEVRRYAAYPGGHAEGYPDTFVQNFSDVYAYIEQGDSSQAPRFPTFEDGRRELVLCGAIVQSAAQKQWVAVDLRA